MSFDALWQEITAFSNKQCGRGASEKEIAVAEAALSVTFPHSYSEFLHRYGWATFAHEEIYGLGTNVPPYLELVKNTVVERNAMRPSLPLHLIPIMNDGSGNHYCLDSAQIHDNECPVVLWDHDLDEAQFPEPVSPSFEAWLLGLLSDLRQT